MEALKRIKNKTKEDRAKLKDKSNQLINQAKYIKELNFNTIGWVNFLYYSILITFFHHFWFYTIEEFHFNRIHILFLKAIANALISTGIFFTIQLISIKRK